MVCLPERWVLASDNPGKCRELQAMLPDCTILLQREFGIASADETATTFVENALLKARHASRHTGLPAIADDSGLVVEALGGAPGIYSARYAGYAASDRDNVQKLLHDMAAIPEPERHARFVCVMVWLRAPDDPYPIIAQGDWQGTILAAPMGDGGFGYDPVFWVPEEHCTAAQLSLERKNQLSHRGQALRALLAQLAARYAPPSRG